MNLSTLLLCQLFRLSECTSVSLNFILFIFIDKLTSFSLCNTPCHLTDSSHTSDLVDEFSVYLCSRGFSRECGICAHIFHCDQ